MIINWGAIETVLLDMDGTLLDLHFDNYFWHEYLPMRWGRKKGIDLKIAKQELKERIQSYEGTLNWYCLDFWSQELDLNLMKVKQEIRQLIRIRNDTELFLEFLKKSNKHIAMVTNAHWDLIQLKFSQTKINRFFDLIHCSHEFGVPKEDEKFWHKLNEACPFRKENTVLFDDNLEVLGSARRYGITHLISIIQPDSNKPPRQILEFQAIDHFSEVMPAI